MKGLQDMDYGLQSDVGADDSCEERQATVYSTSDALSSTVVTELKNALLDGLRGMVKEINPSLTQDTVQEEPRGNQAAMGCDDATDTTRLVSVFPDAKSWKDYVTQYWTSNPACHQYRAGVEMLPHERMVHRSRLSRMKITTEFIREEYGGD
ncbi:hypothetical protein PC128_g26199 [Phytophthora cactorum]|nr:hypothetical protein PC128_g26199 [Phytophthora cactorum]